ncbi:MAG TPA: DUF4188 domain-containing protein [Coleofasciculaceae cyanobacterium]
MAQVIPGRFTAQVDEPFVVFLIGMRINRFFAFSKWLPVARAMGPMLRTLYQNPDKGFLGGQTFFSWRGIAMVQYWRSFEDLEAFARNPDDPHREAWRRFNQAVGDDGSVGIWHETYLIQPGSYEAIYGNMPVFGLASATQHIPVKGRSKTAHGRLKGHAKSEPSMS